jgi:beta-glucosidase-like glycosyl hydrolase
VVATVGLSLGGAAAVGGPTAAAATQADPAAVLASMTLEQQVGEVFMVGGPATGVGSDTVAAVRDRHVGSVILTGRSTAGTAATAAVTAGLQTLATPAATAGTRLLVATDQEGGDVQVLQGPGFSAIPTALLQGTQPTTTLRSSAGTWGRQLGAAGVNVNLAPVLDTVPSPAAAANNPPIGVFQREYGYDPATVASHGLAFAQGMADAGIAATAKHFPGLGRVTQNTDTASGVTDTVTTRTDPYLQPFRSAVQAGIPMLMISTAYYSRIDPANPAAFSSTVIDGMVRGDLGFRGVVVSDDLGNARQVAAWSPGDRAVKFLTAGGDVVLDVNPSLLPTMYDAVLARAETNAGFAAHVRQSALRVLQLKAQHGLLPASAPPLGPAGTLVGGQVLVGGQQVRSPDGRYGLVFQTDGNLVAYDLVHARPLWTSGTGGHPGDVFTFQTDGNAVIYLPDGSVLWTSGTARNPGAVLRVQDDGNVVVYRTDGTAAWFTGWDRTQLVPGDQMLPGQQMTSASGRYWVVLQRDGNVVVYCSDGRPLFFTGSYGSSRLIFQTDGNLVAYLPTGAAAWNSRTQHLGGSRIVMQNDGNLVMYRSDGTPVWDTGQDRGGRATAPGPGTLLV